MIRKALRIIGFLILYAIIVFVWLPDEIRLELILDQTVNSEVLIVELLSFKWFFLLSFIMLGFVSILKDKDGSQDDNGWKEMMKYFFQKLSSTKKIRF